MAKVWIALQITAYLAVVVAAYYLFKFLQKSWGDAGEYLDKKAEQYGYEHSDGQKMQPLLTYEKARSAWYKANGLSGSAAVAAGSAPGFPTPEQWRAGVPFPTIP